MKDSIKKYGFKEGLPVEFEIIDMQQLFKNHKDLLTKVHRTSFYHILWFQKGSPTHLVDFNPIKIKPNTLVFLNRDVVQRFDNKTAFEGKLIIFTDDFYCKTDGDVKFLRNSILFNDLFSVTHIHLFEELKLFTVLIHLMKIELKNSSDNYQPDIIHNLLHNFLLHAERERRRQNFFEIKKGANLDYVLQFKNLLEKFFTDQKLVSNYTNQMGISEKRLNFATSKVLGKSPKEMINERIILEAKRLLAHTAKSVKEIGFELGFNEPTNFIKFFHKHCSTTPINFRNQFPLA